MKHKKNQEQPRNPAGNVPASQEKKRKKRSAKGNRTLTIVFYTVYCVLVAVIVTGLFLANQRLEGLLVEYESSHLSTRTEGVFRDHFASPDWTALYSRTGLSDTAWEDSAAFTAYMESAIGGESLSMAYAGSDPAGGHQYLLTQGENMIGWFTMIDRAPTGAAFPDWQLGQLHLDYRYGEAVTIQKPENATVYVNGAVLTDRETVCILSPLAGDFLPEGIRGPRTHIQYLDGLMVEPRITAADADGNTLEVIYDEARDLYIVGAEADSITDAEYRLALDAAKTYAMYQLKKISTYEMDGYFDVHCDGWTAISSAEPWMQESPAARCEWGQETMTGYRRYGEEVFSVHVLLPVSVPLADETIAHFQVDHTFVFRFQDGNWKCISLTDTDNSREMRAVRITYMLGDTVLYTNFHADDTAFLEPPTISAPAGKEFAGWFLREHADNGSYNYTLVFGPDQTGPISVDNPLEPMTLYALFKDAE